MLDSYQNVLPSIPLMNAFREFLAKSVGLHFPTERHAELSKHLEELACELGEPDASACARRLMSTPIAQAEVEALAGRLTIGETYFFREPETFLAIEQEILPDRIRARQSDRHLRLWSAGCSTGEEAYSLAIVLDRLGGGALSGWDMSVVATDINPGFLRCAGIASYGNWSFRGVDPAVRARYFQPGRNGRDELHARLRERVSFSYLNLAGDGYPSLITNTTGMDLILCRNVLMYFTPDAAARTLSRLRDALADGGWLILGGAEVPLLQPEGMRVVRFDGATALQKKTATRSVLVPERIAGAPAKRRVFRTVPDVRMKARPAARSGQESTAVPSTETLSLQARRHADAGNLDAALACSREALSLDRLDPKTHYVHALIEIEAGRREEGARALRRAIFLQADFAMAHFALASLTLGQGNRAAARRHLDTAQVLLCRYTADQTVPEAEGMNAGQLQRILNSMQEQARGRG